MMRLIETREVLQRSDVIGPRISQVQTLEHEGAYFELPIWSDEDGQTLWHLGAPKEIDYCDACNNDISIDCHDCEQHQQAQERACELAAIGTRHGLTGDEQAELNSLCSRLEEPS